MKELLSSVCMRAAMAAAIVCGVLAGAAGSAQAADVSGEYIVRGVGARSCADYIKSVETNDTQLTAFLSWMEGYLTGINRLKPETFDVSPVSNAPNVGKMAFNLCKSDPSLRFESAIAQLMNFLDPYRVKKQSELVEITVGDYNATLRRSTFIWMQDQLRAKGFFNGKSDGQYGADTKAGLFGYQKANKLEETGVPDIQTFGHMIREPATP